MSNDQHEPPDRLQYRLFMEQRTAEIFTTFLEAVRPRCPVTIIAYPLGGGDWVAWKTTFRHPIEMLDTIKAIVKIWESGGDPRRVTFQENKRLKLPEHQEMIDWSNRIKNIAGDPTFGFSLIAGKGKKYQYMSNGHREDVINVLKNMRL